MTVALVAAVVSAVLSLSGSYLNTTQTQRHNTQQRLISERRLAYGKLLGAAIVLKQTEYFRWVSLFSRRFYEGLSLMEEPGGPSQRDYWQQAMAADDRQASLALESARARRDLFETIAMVQSLFPDDAKVQERAAAILQIPVFSAPERRTKIPGLEELRRVPAAQLQRLRGVITARLRDEQSKDQSELTAFLNKSWQAPIDQLSEHIGATYLSIPRAPAAQP